MDEQVLNKYDKMCYDISKSFQFRGVNGGVVYETAVR